MMGAGPDLGSVSSRECLDALTIFATFTVGRTGLVIVLANHKGGKHPNVLIRTKSGKTHAGISS